MRQYNKHMSAYDLFGPSLKDNPYWDSYTANLSHNNLHLDNEDEIKQAFPKDREAIILTNGVDMIQVNDDDAQGFGLTNAISATADELKLLDAFASLKAKNPDLPVYHIHNHPEGEQTINDLMQIPFYKQDYENLMEREGESMDDLVRNQQQASLVASKADAEAWYGMRHFMNGAIYHQESNELIEWSAWNDESRGTKFGVYPHQYKDRYGKWVPDGTHEIYLAQEGEDIPGVTYINFEDWPEEKHKYYFNKSQLFRAN